MCRTQIASAFLSVLAGRLTLAFDATHAQLTGLQPPGLLSLLLARSSSVVRIVWIVVMIWCYRGY